MEEEVGEYYLGQRSPGKIVAPHIGHRMYYKPAVGKVIYRAAGVMRRSKKVVAINKKLAIAPVKPATACKGKPWKEFVNCLRKKMKEIVGKP